MKKITTLALCAVLSVSMLLSGCASGGKDAPASGGGDTAGTGGSDSITIGYSCVDMNNTFQTYLVDAAKDKAKEMGVEITVVDAQNDVVRQQDQVNAMIQQGVDALVVVAADSSAMEPVTAAAQNANIPIVYCNVNPFGTDFANVPDGAHYVGSDETESGRMQAEMIGPALQEGKVAILMGGLVYEAAHSRTNGNKEIFESKYPGIEVIAEETAEWQRDKAIDVVNNWLSAYGSELNAICANNDEMALGAVEALKAAGRTDVMVVGIDATPDGCAAVQNGELLGTVYQDSVGQGGGAVEIAVKWARGEKPSEKVTMIPYVPVSADNVEEYIGLN